MRKERLLRGKLGIVLASAVLAVACGGPDEELLGTEAEDGIEDGKADWASVKAKTDGTSFTSKDSIPVSVVNGHQHSIYLPGCNEVGLQRLEGTSWKDVAPDKACFWEGLAHQLKGGDTLNTLLLPKPEGTFRVKVVFKTSCAKNTPLSGCKSSERKTYSAKFMVKNECWGAWLDQNGLCRTPADGVYPAECCEKKNECWGAWLDQNGVCRTPADGVYPAECCKGQFCGGIAGIQCPKGQKCILDGNYPDAGGKCVPCAPVLCELYCADGFDTDKDGCGICKCKQPGPTDCRQSGCAAGKYCTFCWTGYMCIPNGAMC